jgi:hypothetical protein
MTMVMSTTTTTMMILRPILIPTCFYLLLCLQTTTHAFQVTKSPTRRPFTSSLLLEKRHRYSQHDDFTYPHNNNINGNNININSKYDDDDDDDNNPIAESITRRQLVFSLLASTIATSTTVMIGLNPQVANGALGEAAVDATPANTASVANAFQNAKGGKLIIPPLDTRSYEIFTLPNGLRVILCSDPSSNTASAAMNVHVGAASDPDTVPGLAHL